LEWWRFPCGHCLVEPQEGKEWSAHDRDLAPGAVGRDRWERFQGQDGARIRAGPTPAPGEDRGLTGVPRGTAGKKTTGHPIGGGRFYVKGRSGLRQRSSVEQALGTRPRSTVNIRHWITSFAKRASPADTTLYVSSLSGRLPAGRRSRHIARRGTSRRPAVVAAWVSSSGAGFSGRGLRRAAISNYRTSSTRRQGKGSEDGRGISRGLRAASAAG